MGGWGSIPGRVETLGSVSVTTTSPYQGVKMVLANVGRTGIKDHQQCGMFRGDTVPIHLEVMAYTKVG